MSVVTLTEAELAELEAMAEAALESGDERALDILGYGEISIVLGSQAESGRYACKRLPPFAARAELEAYTSLVDEYVATLESRGTKPVATETRSLERADGRWAVYCVQSAIDSERLGPELLARASVAEGLDFFERVLGCLRTTIDARLGLDAQISNWAFDGDELLYFDVATPLMRDGSGRERLDIRLFTAALPWLLRGPVHWWMLDDILGKYYDLRRAVLDLFGNLIKERLETWIPTFAAYANRSCAFDKPIELEEIKSYYAFDARMWAALQWLRHADRAWQRRVRRRVYPFLLPENIERNA